MSSCTVFQMAGIQSDDIVDKVFLPPCEAPSHELNNCRQAIEDIIITRCRASYGSCRVVSVDVTDPLEGCTQVHCRTYDVIIDLGENFSVTQHGQSALEMFKVMFSAESDSRCAGVAKGSSFLGGLILRDCKLCATSCADCLWVLQLRFASMSQL